jgi:hypothetical protein
VRQNLSNGFPSLTRRGILDNAPIYGARKRGRVCSARASCSKSCIRRGGISFIVEYQRGVPSRIKVLEQSNHRTQMSRVLRGYYD